MHAAWKIAGTIIVPVALLGCGSSAPSAYVSENAAMNGPYVFQPSTLGFSADGDLTAEHLQWTDWGSRVTVGHGTVIFRSYPSNAGAAEPGTVTLSEQVWCDGQLYYQAGAVRAPGGPFEPSPTTPFTTPCGTGAG